MLYDAPGTGEDRARCLRLHPPRLGRKIPPENEGPHLVLLISQRQVLVVHLHHQLLHLPLQPAVAELQAGPVPGRAGGTEPRSLSCSPTEGPGCGGKGCDLGASCRESAGKECGPLTPSAFHPPWGSCSSETALALCSSTSGPRGRVSPLPLSQLKLSS